MRTAKSVDTAPFRRLYPFRSHFVDRGGYAYHYLDEGAGPPVVMVHGNPTWSFFFRRLVTALSPRYRVVVPDHLGCGLSDTPDPARYDYRLGSRVADLEALMDHLGLAEGVTLVAHDWGGMIGLALAVKQPRRFRRLVVMNTAAFRKPAGKRLPLRLRLIRSAGAVATPAVLGLNLFVRGALLTAARKRLPRDVRRGLAAPYDSPRNRLATLRFVQDIPLSPGDPSYALARRTDEGLHALAGLPMLICWGRGDFVFDMDYLAEWRRRFPDAAVRLFPDAGHYLLEDEPDGVAAAVKAFLRRTEAPAPDAPADPAGKSDE